MPRRGGSAAFKAQTEPDAPPRPCDAAGCDAAGEFRAPRSRVTLNDYYWFCLPHVRAYNASWDFYKGMGPGEIEAHLRNDASWQRPTWPLGRLGGDQRVDPETLRDPLGALHGTPLHAAAAARRRAEAAERRRAAETPQPPAELRAALEVLGLAWPVDSPALRARYKELAKRYHPDANGGDRTAEEKLKDVNRAYSLLRARLGASGGAGGAAGGSTARSGASHPPAEAAAS